MVTSVPLQIRIRRHFYLIFVICHPFFSKMPPRSKKPCLVIPGQLKLNFRPKSEDTVKGIMMIHYCRVVKTGFWSSQLLRPYIHGRNHWGSGGSRPPQLLGRPQIFTLHFAGGRLLVRSGHWKSLGGLANAKYCGGKNGLVWLAELTVLYLKQLQRA